MMLASAVTALLLLPLDTGPLPGSRFAAPAGQGAAKPAAGATTPAASSAKDDRAALAADYYAKGRYVEASLEFEGLWRDFPGEPRFLFNAAASRYIAGHYAHTVAYLNEYLARREIQGDDRKEAQAQLDEARNKVAALKVAVALPPGTTGEVTVVVQPVARGASDLRPELPFPARVGGQGAEVVVQLEPGSWVVRARGAGLQEAEQRVEVTKAAGQRVQLQLTAAAATADPAAPPGTAPIDAGVPLALAHKLKIGFAVGGGVAAVTGITVLVVGAVARGDDDTCGDVKNDFDSCKKDLAGSLRTRDAGAAVLGTGVGLLAGGLTWIASDPGKRRKAWIAEAAVGGAALVGGAVWLSISSLAFNKANTSRLEGMDPDAAWAAHYSGAGVAPQHAASAAVFGLGAGLITSSVTGLLVQRKYRGSKRAALRTLRVDGLAGAGRAGLVLSGRF